MRRNAVLAYPDDLRPFFHKLRIQFSERARLFCTAGRIILGVKIQNHFFPLKLAQTAQRSILVRQRKLRRLYSDFQHKSSLILTFIKSNNHSSKTNLKVPLYHSRSARPVNLPSICGCIHNIVGFNDDLPLEKRIFPPRTIELIKTFSASVQFRTHLVSALCIQFDIHNEQCRLPEERSSAMCSKRGRFCSVKHKCFSRGRTSWPLEECTTKNTKNIVSKIKPFSSSPFAL